MEQNVRVLREIFLIFVSDLILPMRRTLFSIALILAAATGLQAQNNTFTIDLDLLTRGEIRAGGLTRLDDEKPDFAAFVLDRTLLGIGYERPYFSARITAQHSGTWGNNEESFFGLYEAWAHVCSPKGFFAKVGRQNLSYDDQRIFGADDWAMTARSHDALKIGYEGYGHKVHLIGAYNQNLANISGGTFFKGGIQPYKSMAALWYHYDVPKVPFGFSLLFLDAGMQDGEPDEDEKVWHQQMAGAYLSYKPEKWSAEAAYYHQFGKEEHGLPVNAFMASSKFTYTPEKHWTLTAGYDYLSGDKDFATPTGGTIGLTRHEVIRGFSSLYGSHHKFYGAMDFFYMTTYVGGFTPGLQNAYAGLQWTFKEKHSVSASYHFLATGTKLRNAEMPLGHELEIAAFFQIFKDGKLGFGYSFMKGTDTMTVLKKTADRRELHWGWLMLTISPRIFTAKW